jgi:hypothetical protein
MLLLLTCKQVYSAKQNPTPFDVFANLSVQLFILCFVFHECHHRHIHYDFLGKIRHHCRVEILKE